MSAKDRIWLLRAGVPLLALSVLLILLQGIGSVAAGRFSRNEGYVDPLFSVMEPKYSKDKAAFISKYATNNGVIVMSEEEFLSSLLSPTDFDVLLLIGIKEAIVRDTTVMKSHVQQFSVLSQFLRQIFPLNDDLYAVVIFVEKDGRNDNEAPAVYFVPRDKSITELKSSRYAIFQESYISPDMIKFTKKRLGPNVTMRQASLGQINRPLQGIIVASAAVSIVFIFKPSILSKIISSRRLWATAITAVVIVWTTGGVKDLFRDIMKGNLVLRDIYNTHLSYNSTPAKVALSMILNTIAQNLIVRFM